VDNDNDEDSNTGDDDNNDKDDNDDRELWQTAKSKQRIRKMAAKMKKHKASMTPRDQMPRENEAKERGESGGKWNRLRLDARVSRGKNYVAA